MAYFEQLSPTRFRATEHVGGAWEVTEQHIAPALGLLVHVVEADRDARRDDGLVVTRLSYDILGTLPVAEVECTVSVLRPGRTIELVEARLSHGGRDAVILRCWLMRPGDTSALEGSGHEAIPGPGALDPWDATSVWKGGFIRSAQVRRQQREPGRACYWARSDHQLLADVSVSPLAHFARLLDIANGMTVRADPATVAFPNVDLTAHLFREPQGDWTGFDTSVSFGPRGVGLTSSVLHDELGPVGTLAQILTVRP